jgi:alpha-beta hydrolase superfamily lysophospholipase
VSDLSSTSESQPTSMHEHDLDDWSEQARSEDQRVNAGAVRQTVIHAVPVDHSGLMAYVKGWLATEGSPRGSVVVVHDIGENAGSYRDFARKLIQHGFNVYAFDLRGHGRSGRMLGHINQFADFVNDLLQVCAWIRHQEDGRAPVILGHGLGGLIAQQFADEYARYCRGIALLSPAFLMKSTGTVWQKFFLKSLAEIIPTTRIQHKICEGMKQSNASDRFSIIGALRGPAPFRPTARFIQEILTVMNRVERGQFRNDIATFFLVPRTDNLYDHASVRQRLQESFASGNSPELLVTAELQMDGHHLLRNGSETLDEALKEVLLWLDSRFGSKVGS